jgi:hypothetical protein
VNPDPTGPDVAMLMAVARSTWREERAGSAAVWMNYVRLLHQYDPNLSADEVRYALDCMGLTTQWFPTPAEIIETIRAEREERRRQADKEAARLRLAAARPAFRDQAANLAAWDRGQQEWVQAAVDELHAFELRRTDASKRTPEQLAAEEARLRTPGPFAQRCRALLAGEVTAGEGVDAYIAQIAAAKDVPRLMGQPEEGAWDPAVHRQAVRADDLPRIKRQLLGLPVEGAA